MADVQKEHGYTAIANELLEAILRAPFSWRELRVLLAVARDTYGWADRKTWRITAYRVRKLTGIDRTHASRAMKNLICRGVLVCDATGQVGIRKDYDLWDTGDAPRTGIRSAPGASQPHEGDARRLTEGGARRRTIKTIEEVSKARKATDADPATWESCSWPSPEALAALYNRWMPAGHPRLVKLTPGRRKKAATYLRDFPDREFWESVVREIPLSRFLTHGSAERPNFRGDFDWLLTRGKDGTENAVKVAEGKYRNTKPATGASQAPGHPGLDLP